ncbi:ATP-binding protein [Mucilaginibacter sp. PAMB04168]|uniref:ATP-binding protein n=1 Tax=Mucilaginibacter sp. PAMB04168 TaxID=3138567 RepID=UPI0031F62BEA
MNDVVNAQMFEALFNQSPSPVSVVRADAPAFTIVAVNDVYVKRSHLNKDQILNKPSFDVYRPWDEASAEQFKLLREGLMQAVYDKQQVNLPTLSFDAPAKDGEAGSRSWWQIQISPVLDTAGEVEYLMCVTRNVTEQEQVRKQAEESREKEQELNEELQVINEELAATNEELTSTIEELSYSQERLSRLNNELEERITARTAALTASERRYKTILNTLPQIAWTTTLQGEVSFFNQRWYEYTGLSVEQSKATGWEDVIHPDDLEYSVRTYRDIVATKRPGEYELREKGTDGIYRWHLIRVQPIRNEFGDIEHWIGTATDIDSIKQLQQQKDDFISIASHELKTPITSLKASLQLMDKVKDNPTSDMMPRLILQSRKSIQRVSVLIEDLLNVSRLQQGEVQLNKSTFIVSQLLNACCNPIAIMGKQKIKIDGEVELQVCADEHRIDQVVTNLVNNAVKYAPESEYITLCIEKDFDMVKVSVSDNGPGVPEDKIPHLFDRYYRVDSSGYHASGLGLGLYISAEIIKRHGGEIGVDSKIGKGSTFWFTLPLIEDYD